MAELVLVAGATGHLGSCVVHALRARGFRVRAAGRNAKALAGLGQLPGVELFCADLSDPSAASRAVQGVAMVVSAMGASVSVYQRGDRLGLERSDVQANRTLIAAAEQAQVLHFLYVSVFHDKDMEHLEYVRVHTQIEHELRASKLGAIVVRPTGFYYALAQMRRAARVGFLPCPGDGLARTNAIDEQELGHYCVDVLLRGPGIYPVGGPEILTRADILRTLMQSAGQVPRLVPTPLWILRLLARGLVWMHPRLGHLLQFFLAISTHDCVAPAYGQRRLTEYLARSTAEF